MRLQSVQFNNWHNVERSVSNLEYIQLYIHIIVYILNYIIYTIIYSYYVLAV